MEEEKIDYKDRWLKTCLENLDKKIDQVLAQATKTNNRVNHLEEESNKRAVIVEDFRHLEKDFDCVKQKVEEIDKNLLEFWFLKKYPKVALGIIMAAVLGTLGISYFNKRDNSDIREDVNHINSILKIPNAPTRSLNAYPDTIK